MDRRSFAKLLGLGAATIIVPQFGRFYREGQDKLWTAQYQPGNGKYEVKVGRTIYVDCRSTGGDGSVERPFPSLREALNNVKDNGTNIIIAQSHTEVVADAPIIVPNFYGMKSQRYFVKDQPMLRGFRAN